MAETAQEYIGRMLSYVGERDPWDVLATSPPRLRALVQQQPAGVLTWASEPGRWSIVQIAAHLADAEIVAAWRVRSVLASDGVPLQPFDQNAWAAAFRYERVPLGESLDVFETLRASLLRLLRDVDPSRHAHAGMHAERGREPITHLVRLYAGHDLNHLAQVERLLAEAPRGGGA